LWAILMLAGGPLAFLFCDHVPEVAAVRAIAGMVVSLPSRADARDL